MAEQEITIGLAVRRLGDEVSGWLDPVPFTFEGRMLCEDPLMVMLVDAVGGTRNGCKGFLRLDSRSPAFLDALDLLESLRLFAVENTDSGKDVPDRLRAMASRQWGCDDAVLVAGLAVRLAGLSKAARDLLELNPPTVHLEYDCPRCSVGWVRRRRGDEFVRVRSLSVSESGASCANCSASWSFGELPWLARTLGCEPVGV